MSVSQHDTLNCVVKSFCDCQDAGRRGCNTRVNQCETVVLLHQKTIDHPKSGESVQIFGLLDDPQLSAPPKMLLRFLLVLIVETVAHLNEYFTRVQEVCPAKG